MYMLRLACTSVVVVQYLWSNMYHREKSPVLKIHDCAYTSLEKHLLIRGVPRGAGSVGFTTFFSISGLEFKCASKEVQLQASFLKILMLDVEH